MSLEPMDCKFNSDDRLNLVNVQPIDFLKDIPLFAELNEEELTELLREMDVVFFPAGHRIFDQGQEADGLYVIERGEVSVTIQSDPGPDLLLAHLGNGSVIGEMALISGGPRSALVRSLSPSQGYFLSKEKFETLQNSGSATAYKVILQLARILDERRRLLEQQIRRMRRDPKKRTRHWGEPTRELIARVRKG